MMFYHEAWKGMLDGNNFVRAGWVHALKLHQYQTAAYKRFLVMGKLSWIIEHF